MFASPQKNTSTERFFSHILVPLWILTSYFFSFSKVLPSGVNNLFVTYSGKYTFWVSSVLSLVFLFIIGFKKGKFSLPEKSEKKFSSSKLILLLLPLAPATQYILNNLDILSALDAIYVFFIFTIFTAFFVLFIPMFFKRIGSSQVLMFLGLAFSFSIINMASLSQEFAWHRVGNLGIQLIVFLGIFLLSWLFFYSKNQKILYTLIVIIFLTANITPFLERMGENSDSFSPETNNKLLSLINSREPKIKPSIYLLIYDAYVVNETMLSYGIDNSAQEEYLEELGFQIYPHTYSIGNMSIDTMSRVLNASTEFYGNKRRAVSGDGVVQNLLKKFGYKTYGIFFSDYFFQGVASSHYDYSFPKHPTGPKNLLIKAIFTGEFRFDIGFDEISSEQFIEEKTNVFSQKTEFPKFIDMHSSKPGHSQNSGTCLPNEVDLFHEKLLKANLEMKDDIKVILENDPDSIIIIAGDHGPYLKKNCTLLTEYNMDEIYRVDIQDRHGTFLAIRWPTQDFDKYDDITVLQDLFPAIFAYIFQDQNLLEAKVNSATILNDAINDARVLDGIIEGGFHDGEPLFLERNE